MVYGIALTRSAAIFSPAFFICKTYQRKLSVEIVFPAPFRLENFATYTSTILNYGLGL